jgi:hypothetical protein
LASRSGGKSGSSKGGASRKGSERRIVQQHPDGGWEVLKPGSRRSSTRTQTQTEAIDRAREILQNVGGGELTTRGRNGQFRDSDTVPPGNDPNPPRDKTS